MMHDYLPLLGFDSTGRCDETSDQNNAARGNENTMSAREAVLVRLADVAPRKHGWLWPNRMPLGGLTILTGEAGLDLDCLCYDLAARVSSGAAWPHDEGMRGDTERGSRKENAEGQVRERGWTKMDTRSAKMPKMDT